MAGGRTLDKGPRHHHGGISPLFMETLHCNIFFCGVAAITPAEHPAEH
jgi:hypothetical protein